MKKCSASIRGEGSWGGFHKRPCKKPYFVTREGLDFCKIHDPEKVKERNAKSMKAWKDKSRLERPKWYANSLLALLIESQTSISDDWRKRRDELINTINAGLRSRSP